MPGDIRLNITFEENLETIGRVDISDNKNLFVVSANSVESNRLAVRLPTDIPIHV